MSETPILDRIQPVPKTSETWPKIAGAIVGAAIGLAAIRYGWHVLSAGGLEIALLCWVSFFLAVLIHECGHLIAGLATDFSFRQFSAGPVLISREKERLRIRLVPSRWMGGGHVMAVPGSLTGLRSGFVRFTLGGPVATALAILVGLALPESLFTRCFVGTNLLLAPFSWLPLTVNGYASDAKLILGLLRKGKAGDRIAAVLYLMAIDAAGVRPQDWPADLVQSLSHQSGDQSHLEIGLIYQYCWCADTGDPVRLAESLERVLRRANKLTPDLRRTYFAEAAFVQGTYRGNGSLATAWLDEAGKVKGTLPKENWDGGALAGIACADGDAAGAIGHLARAIAMLDREPGVSGSRFACRERLAALMETQQGKCLS